MTSRETSDLIMMGIGAFTLLDGFMGKEDWQGCCETHSMPSRRGLFWPIPITLWTDQGLADSIAVGDEVALLLGHSTVRITERHYAPWVREWQEMEDDVRRAWKIHPLLNRTISVQFENAPYKQTKTRE